MTPITLEMVRTNPIIETMVIRSNACLAAIGYTDHGPRHVGYVSRMASEVMKKLGYEKRVCELASIAGWVHDVGNLICRKNHGLTGATLLFPLLREMGMPIEEVCIICSAVGNHEEETGQPVDEVSSALIIADKIDAHRARVRQGSYNPADLHDRVNYAIHKTNVIVDAEKKDICFAFMMEPTSSVMDYMSIYLSRMLLCEKAAAYLGCTFSLMVNDMPVNSTAHAKLRVE